MKKISGRRSATASTKQNTEPCRHPAIFKSMCVSCGEILGTASSTSASQKGGNVSNTGSSSSAGPNSGQSNSSSLLFAGGQRLILSNEEALRVQQSKFLGLQSVRKLALVLDLDHTLVHATGAWPGYATSLGSLLGNSSNDIRRIFIEEGPGMQPKCYLVKLRPHLEAFLKETHIMFQMSIYTAGTRLYAEAVAKLMDPLGIYFARRIVSRSDIPNDKSEGMDKSLRRIFLEDASMVAILDDREDVWKGEQAAQLLLVRPFHYFTGCEEVNNTAGSPPVASGPLIKLSGDRPGSIIDPTSTTRSVSCSPNGAEQSGRAHAVNGQNEYDDQLPRCLDILKGIHNTFFSSSPVITASTSVADGADLGINEESKGEKTISVAKIINGIKSSILAGCTIAFSGVIPVRSPVDQHSCWRLAESLGARVTAEVIEETTHLLSVSMPPPPGAQVQGLPQGQQYLTSKAKECLGRGNVWVLHPDWLLYCRYCLARAEESTFMLVAQPPGKPFPNPQMRIHPKTIPSSPSSSAGTVAVENSSLSDNRMRVRFREDDEEVGVEDGGSESGDASGRSRSSKRWRYGDSDDGTGAERDPVDSGGDGQDAVSMDYIGSSDEDRSSHENRLNDSTVGDDSVSDGDSDEGSLDNFDAIIMHR